MEVMMIRYKRPVQNTLLEDEKCQIKTTLIFTSNSTTLDKFTNI